MGDEDRIESLAPRGLKHDSEKLLVHHPGQVIAMDESPSAAVSEKTDSSIVVATGLVQPGQGQALVSAGNTGATVLACAQGLDSAAGRAPIRFCRGVPRRAPTR